MSGDARSKLELSKEGRQFLEVVAKCNDSQLATSLIEVAARLVTTGASGKENVPMPNVLDAGDARISIKGLTFIHPRGKFDLDFGTDTLTVRNAKTVITMPMNLLAHVAILDNIPNDPKRRCLLFFALDKNGTSVMNGKQRLECLLIQTLESDTLSTRATSGEFLEGPTAAVLSQAVGLSRPHFSNFVAPDPEAFETGKGDNSVPAVVKASLGMLFPLRGALLFIERPPLFLPHSGVAGVEYRRPQSTTFDLVVHLTEQGDAKGSSVEFSQVDRTHLPRLQSYFASSGIKLYDPEAARSGAAAAALPRNAGAAADDEEDRDAEDEDDEDEDEDEDFDPSQLEQEEASSKQRASKRTRREPAGSGAAGSSSAGPSGSRPAARPAANVSEDDESEFDDEGEEEDDEDEDDEDEDEDELADLTDEEDLAAAVVRQAVQRPKGGGDGGRAGGSRKRGRQPVTSSDESEEDEK